MNNYNLLKSIHKHLIYLHDVKGQKDNNTVQLINTIADEIEELEYEFHF